LESDGEMALLLTQIEEAEKWIGPVPDRVRRSGALSALVSYFIVFMSVSWDIAHPAMFTLYAISAFGVVGHLLLKRRAHRRVEHLLERYEVLKRAVDS
jgi:hypothetical protein